MTSPTSPPLSTLGPVADTAPYPWPWDGSVVPARLALVIVGAGTDWEARSARTEEVAAVLDRLSSAVLGAGGAVLPADRIETLELQLRTSGYDQLLIGGYGLEAPVHSILRGLNDRGFECLLVTDACAPLAPEVPETVAAAASSVTMSGGIFGAIGTADSVLRMLSPEP